MVRVTVGAGDDVVAFVRAAEAESVLVLLDPALDAIGAAQTRAAVEPLAVERAPVTRVNAVSAAADADPRDVEYAARYLEGAGSVTGQLLEVAAR